MTVVNRQEYLMKTPRPEITNLSTIEQDRAAVEEGKKRCRLGARTSSAWKRSECRHLNSLKLKFEEKWLATPEQYDRYKILLQVGIAVGIIGGASGIGYGIYKIGKKRKWFKKRKK